MNFVISSILCESTISLELFIVFILILFQIQLMEEHPDEIGHIQGGLAVDWRNFQIFKFKFNFFDMSCVLVILYVETVMFFATSR